MQKDDNMKGFEPVYSDRSKALILGTWPSPKSFEMGFYYGHKQNRFWPLIAALTGRDRPETIEERKRLILDSGLALWDTIESCTIEGASDASIRDVEARDIGWLLEKAPIEAVFCNGTKAYEVFTKQHGDVGLPVYKMPSTSPANAAWSFEKLLKAWDPLRRYI